MSQTQLESESAAVPTSGLQHHGESPVSGGWVLVVGASSGIGRAITRRWAAEGSDVILAGRDLDDLNRSAADLRIRYGRRAEVVAFDALAFESHDSFWRECQARAGGLAAGDAEAGQAEAGQAVPSGALGEDRALPGADAGRDRSGELAGIILLHGYLPPQDEAQEDLAVARRAIDTNFTSAVSLLTLAANDFERRRSGFLCVFSSVAGDRGRQSNYVYGSAKAALSAFLSGLRNRLFKSGVSVITVKPGFVDTPMTWGLGGMFLVASPEKVAADVYRAVQNGNAEVYTPWFWRYIMLIIKAVPEVVFKRMKM